MIPYICVSYGRSGTQSLAKILGADHERKRFPWHPTLSSVRSVSAFMGSEKGQVGFTNLSHLQFMRALNPALPVINLRRDRASVVKSHLRICGGNDRLSADGLKDGFSHAYPSLPSVLMPEQGWGCWWDIVTGMMDQIAHPKYDLWMHDLNCDEKMDALCDWLTSVGAEIPDDFQLPANRWWDVNA